MIHGGRCQQHLPRFCLAKNRHWELGMGKETLNEKGHALKQRVQGFRRLFYTCKKGGREGGRGRSKWMKLQKKNRREN